MVGDGNHTTESGQSWCGACGNQQADGDVCSRCGRPLEGDVAERLRAISWQRYELETAADQLRRDMRTLDDERVALLRASAPVGPGAPGRHDASSGGTPARQGNEWRPEVVSDVLVWLGATLLALAALTFVAVAFTRLSSSGRTVLMGTSALVPFGLALLLRRRLPHTAEAVFVLSVVFAGIAGGTSRHIGGAPHVSGLAWLAVSAAVAALFTGAVGQWIGFASARALAAIATVVSLGATAFTIHGSRALLTATFSAVAVVLVVATALARRAPLWRRGPYALFATGVAAVWCTAAGFAADAVLAGHRHDLAAGLAVASLAIAPLCARAVRTRLDFVADARGRGALAVAATALAAAVVVVLSGHAHGDALAAWVALLGTALIVASARAGADVAQPVSGVGALFLGAATLSAIGPFLAALLQPFGWSGHAWTAPATLRLRDHLEPDGPHLLGRGVLPGIVVLVAGAAAVARSHLQRAGARIELDAAGAVATALAGSYLLVASGANARTIAIGCVALAVIAFGGVATARRRASNHKHRAVSLVFYAALVALIPAVTTSIAVRSIAIGVTAALALGFVLAAWLERDPMVQDVAIVGGIGSYLVCVGATISALSIGREAVARTTVGLVVSIVAAVIVALAALWRGRIDARESASVTAHLGVGIGIALCSGSVTNAAIAITLLAVAHGVGSLRWAPYRVLAAASAIAATWAWLAAAGVRVVEAYTLPAASIMLVAGLVYARTHRDASSWSTIAPGLLLAFAPTLALAVEHHDAAARAIPLTIAALVTVIIGARARVQAPLVLGAATLVALGVDLFGPVAARWPRWIALGIAGVALLWLGATAERRLRQARAWSQTFGAFR